MLEMLGREFFILPEDQSTPSRVEARGQLLRIFIDEDDRYAEQPLYEAIAQALRAAGFAGATVLKGIEGYGCHRVVHSARLVDLNTNLPIVIEVIESEEKVRAFLPTLRAMIPDGMLTLEKVDIIRLSKAASP
jgi:PII-like signaling protein